MHDLHVPAGVNARPASAGAKLIEDVLANALLRVVAVTHEKLLKLLVAHQASDEIVDDGCEGVVAADTFVQRLLLSFARYRDSCRQQQGKDHAQECDPLKT